MLARDEHFGDVLFGQVTGQPMVNGALCALPIHFSAKRDGATYCVEGDKIVEVWLFSAVQEGEDAFWDAG